ncbi:MAG: hypothetical protein RIR41_533, partial [Pseudomonadota bacterium]
GVEIAFGHRQDESVNIAHGVTSLL